MNSLFHKILEYKLYIIGLFALIVISGTNNLIKLPVDAVPDITNVQVMINAKTGALDPEQIEKTVTYVVEYEMGGLPGLQEIRSLSKYGLSQVILVFEDGTDIYFARQQVSQRLQAIAELLPKGVSPELAAITTGLGEIVMYNVLAKPGSKLAAKPEFDQLMYLRTIQDYTIRPELKKVKGVAEVDSNGGYRKEIHVNVKTENLEKYGITFDDLEKKLSTLGDSYGGGYIQKNQKQVIVRTTSDIPEIDKINQIPIKLDVRGRALTLKEIAEVREDYTPRLGAALLDGKQAVLGTALMYIGANSREVSRDVEEAIKNLKLPEDVEVKIVYTRSFLVDKTIQTVATNLAEGAGLVVVVLLLLLGSLRAAVIVAMAIPLSMLFAATGMRFFGISANLMSLGAIDFGLLVDGSVVMIENLLRHYHEVSDPRSLTIKQRIELVVNSASEVAKPVTLGLLIIMLVYVPILTLTGIEGKMFHPMALTVLIALGASLVIALFLMPILGYLVIRPFKVKTKTHGDDSKLFSLIQKAYNPTLNFALRHKKIILSCTVVFALFTVFLFTRLGSTFIPKFDEGDLVIGLARDTSMSLDESIRQQAKVEDIIRTFPEVEHVFSRIGTPESATDPMGVNFSDTFVILKKEGKHKLNKEQLFAAISERIEKEVPGHNMSPTQPIEMRLNEVLEGSRADVSLRIFGPDLSKLMEYIQQAEKVIGEIKGVSEVEMDALTALTKSPILNIALDYDAMNKYGVNIQDANKTLEMAMGGIQIGNFYEMDRRFPIVLHLDEEIRNDEKQIQRIPVALADGGSIPLEKVANFSESDQVTTIARSFGKRYAALAIYLQNRDVVSFVEEAKIKIKDNVQLDPGYSISWGGQFKNLEKARTRLLLIVPVTLLIIFIILLMDFKSVKQALLVYSSIPLAITGGILFLYIRGIPFSVSASIGFIALLGIAILNSMVLVDFINQLRAKGASVHDAVIEGAKSRLRPVLMTAFVAGVGFIPMAYNVGMGAEVQRPLATVVIGGIVTSTILTLLLLPALYIWIEGDQTTSSDFKSQTKV